MHEQGFQRVLKRLSSWKCTYSIRVEVYVFDAQSTLLVVSLQHETIEHLLERGEKLSDLVDKTDKLSGTSKAFYKEVSLTLQPPLDKYQPFHLPHLRLTVNTDGAI